MDESIGHAVPEHNTVVVRGGRDGYRQDVEIGAHRCMADEPVSLGGADAGPSPYELLLAGLGACTSMTIRMYAHRKQWPLEEVTVRLTHAKIYARDCADCETKEGKIDHIEREIELHGALSDEQRTRLLEIANRCPVHRTLKSEIDIKSRLKN